MNTNDHIVLKYSSIDMLKYTSGLKPGLWQLIYVWTLPLHTASPWLLSYHCIDLKLTVTVSEASGDIIEGEKNYFSSYTPENSHKTWPFVYTLMNQWSIYLYKSCFKLLWNNFLALDNVYVKIVAHI